MEAAYRFRFSEEHLLTSFLRYRQQIWWRRPFYGLKWLLGLLLAVPLIFFAGNGLVIPAGVFGAFLGALLLGWPIDTWIMRRRFRKSPFHGDDIGFFLSEEGSRVVGRDHEARLGWATFTKARRFKDGLLLFQGPHVFYWLPDVAISDPSAIENAQRFIRAHIADYRDV